MDQRATILNVIKSFGPAIPSEVKDQTGIELTFVGAFLSELVASKELVITHAKIGGSPVYYIRGQEEQLSKLFSHLNEKDRRLYAKLEENSILRDEDLSSLEKASARALHDFSVPLSIKWNDETILFWKWHLTTNDEAVQLIRNKLAPSKVEKKEAKPVQPPPTPKEPETSKPLPKVHKQPAQETLEAPLPDDPLINTLLATAQHHSMTITKATVLRAKKDCEATALLHVGESTMRVYVRIKDKKKCNDADLSQAFVQAQLKHLSCCFMTTGELTKKTKDLLLSDFKGMLVMENI